MVKSKENWREFFKVNSSFHIHAPTDQAKNTFNLVQSLDWYSRWWDMRDHSAEIFQSVLQVTLHEQFWHVQGYPLLYCLSGISSASQCHPPSKVPWRMVLERLLWHVTCLSHASFHLMKGTQLTLLMCLAVMWRCLSYKTLVKPEQTDPCAILNAHAYLQNCQEKKLGIFYPSDNR